MDGDVDWCKITATLHSTIISQHNDLRDTDKMYCRSHNKRRTWHSRVRK